MEREIESSAADRIKSQRDDLAKFLGQLADRLEDIAFWCEGEAKRCADIWRESLAEETCPET